MIEQPNRFKQSDLFLLTTYASTRTLPSYEKSYETSYAKSYEK